MFIAALFTIANTWKQSKYPLTDKWIQKMQYIYTKENYLKRMKLKESEIMPFAATWTQLEIIILSESERERQMAYVVTYMWNLKYVINELIYKTETDSQTQRTYLWLPRGVRGGGGKDWEFEISRCKLLYIGWISILYIGCIAQGTILTIL